MTTTTGAPTPWELAELEMRLQRALLDPCDRKRLEAISRTGTPSLRERALRVLDQAAA